MNITKALLMSVGMFSVFPVPKNHWDDRALPWVVPLMPIVGVGIGIAWYATALCVMRLPLSLQCAAVLMAPFFLSGFLHVDGYMDTADAVFSRRSLEERRRILKDSHVGAFAVIALVCLFLIEFCAVQAIISERKALTALIFIPVVSRSLSALAILNMKPMADTGYMVTFRANTGRRHTTFVVLTLAVMLPTAHFVGELPALMTLGVVIMAAMLTTFYVNRQMRGMSGDLCGCVIVVSEMCGLVGLAVWS